MFELRTERLWGTAGGDQLPWPTEIGLRTQTKY